MHQGALALMIFIKHIEVILATRGLTYFLFKNLKYKYNKIIIYGYVNLNSWENNLHLFSKTSEKNKQK